MSYYQGDYYQGDFWGRIGKGIRKGVRSIGRIAKQAAPLAGLVLPAVGTATLLGKTVALAQRTKKAGRALRVLRSVAPAPGSPQAMASAMTGTPIGMTAPEPPPRKISAGSKTVERIRRAKRRRAASRSKARTYYRRRTQRRRSTGR